MEQDDGEVEHVHLDRAHMSGSLSGTMNSTCATKTSAKGSLKSNPRPPRWAQLGLAGPARTAFSKDPDNVLSDDEIISTELA